jgi:hypothetical protein
MVHLVTQALWPVRRPLSHWAENSQRHACRNAMVASTAITQTRRERDEVQEFVDTLIARRSRSQDNAAGHATPLLSALPAARLG